MTDWPFMLFSRPPNTQLLELFVISGIIQYEYTYRWAISPCFNFRILLSNLGPELLHNRDESGKLPIHIACRSKAPVEVLALLVEHDTATLQMADRTGTLPLHECCCGAVDYSSVRFLVEKGDFANLAARNQEGALPQHLLCESTNPSLRTVHYLIQSYPEAVAAQTNAGHYPFMKVASLSLLYELVRTNPGFVTFL